MYHRLYKNSWVVYTIINLGLEDSFGPSPRDFFECVVFITVYIHAVYIKILVVLHIC